MSDLVYVYQAAIYCEECGEKIRDELTAAENAPADPDDESSYDSDDFPKGPYPEGGGEADCPQHCAECGEFLENPLTDEGVRYVREAIEDALLRVPSKDPLVQTAEHAANEYSRHASVALDEWRGFYGIEPEDPRVIRLARLAPAVRKLADEKSGEVPSYAWPGGYPMFYVDNQGDCYCSSCANDPEGGIDAFRIVAGDVNYEDGSLYCDGCSERIEAAYVDSEDENDDNPEHNETETTSACSASRRARSSSSSGSSPTASWPSRTDELGGNLHAFAENEPTAIPEGEFEDYARELAADIGAVQDDAGWPQRHIDWKAAADELQQDYTSFEFDGETYLVRSY